MARHDVLLAILLVTFICAFGPAWSLKCRADDEVTNEEDYRDAVRVCMSNLTSERDEQGYRPDDSGGGGGGGNGNGNGNSGGGGKRQHNRNRGDRGDRHGNNGGDDSNSGGGSRRPNRPSNRPGMSGGSCDSGYGNNNNNNNDRYGNNNDRYGNNNDRYGNNNGYGMNSNGGMNNNNGGGYNNNGGYGSGYYGGYGAGMPQHRNRGPMPGGTLMQGGGVMGGGPMTGIPLAGRPRTRRSTSTSTSTSTGGYAGSRDGRIGTALDGIDSCIVHCIFRQMQMLNENARPDKDAVIAVMTQRVRDRELREFIQYSVDECFEYSQSESNRSINKCDFAKKLALCLEEKAKRHCDDWEDDGNSRGDQRGDRDRGSNGQRPPRQHYVGR